MKQRIAAKDKTWWLYVHFPCIWCLSWAVFLITIEKYRLIPYWINRSMFKIVSEFTCSRLCYAVHPKGCIWKDQLHPCGVKLGLQTICTDAWLKHWFRNRLRNTIFDWAKTFALKQLSYKSFQRHDMITIITDRINYRGEDALYLHVSWICAPCVPVFPHMSCSFPTRWKGLTVQGQMN